MDKIDRLLDLLENPERYSDQEIEEILADPEVRETYGLLAKTKSSLSPIQVPDVDSEWKQFSRSHREGLPILRKLLYRNTAAAIAIGIASLAAIATVVGVSLKRNIVSTETVPSLTVTDDTKGTASDSTLSLEMETPMDSQPETILFDNESLGDILNRIGEYYGYNVQFNAPEVSDLRLYFRWDQSQSPEEVAKALNNFEQIHIILKDNTIIAD